MSRETPIDQINNNLSKEEDDIVNSILSEINQESEQKENIQQMPQQMQQQMPQQPANVVPTLEEPKSMVDNIVDIARQPIIVTVVCILISVPQISTGLANVLNKNAKLAKYSTILLLLIKGLLGGGMYFGINKSIN